MKIYFVWFAALLAVGCCPGQPPASTVSPATDAAASSQHAVAQPASVPVVAPAIDWARHGLADNGCFIMRDLATGRERVSDEARCDTPRRPHSTFKIANALIGLDLGILSGPDATMIWDRERYPAEAWWPDTWGHDQPLRSAIAVSAVPLFRRLATQVGADNMQRYLDAFGYGNRDISGGLDVFWLSGALRISARQQVDFVAKLVGRKLPAQRSAQDAVVEVLRRDDHGTAHVFGKTGTGKLEDANAKSDTRSLGWLVGWVEHDRGSFAYALWVQGDSMQAVGARRTKTFNAVLDDVLTAR